jgi:hypothetical protein
MMGISRAVSSGMAMRSFALPHGVAAKPVPRLRTMLFSYRMV